MYMNVCVGMYLSKLLRSPNNGCMKRDVEDPGKIPNNCAVATQYFVYPA